MISYNIYDTIYDITYDIIYYETYCAFHRRLALSTQPSTQLALGLSFLNLNTLKIHRIKSLRFILRRFDGIMSSESLASLELGCREYMTYPCNCWTLLKKICLNEPGVFSVGALKSLTVLCTRYATSSFLAGQKYLATRARNIDTSTTSSDLLAVSTTRRCISLF